METLRHILLVLHLLGFAALFGGMFLQMRAPEKSINSAMRDGAGTVFLTGLLLVGVLEGSKPDGVTLDHTKIGIKLVIALIILVLVMANLRKPSIPEGLFWGIFGLTVINVGVAVFVSSVHQFS